MRERAKVEDCQQYLAKQFRREEQTARGMALQWQSLQLIQIAMCVRQHICILSGVYQVACVDIDAC